MGRRSRKQFFAPSGETYRRVGVWGYRRVTSHLSPFRRSSAAVQSPADTKAGTGRNLRERCTTEKPGAPLQRYDAAPMSARRVRAPGRRFRNAGMFRRRSIQSQLPGKPQTAAKVQNHTADTKSIHSLCRTMGRQSPFLQRFEVKKPRSQETVMKR
jgi:hypothetical protein